MTTPLVVADLCEPNLAICDEISSFFVELSNIATNWLLNVSNANEQQVANDSQFLPGTTFDPMEFGRQCYMLIEHIGSVIGSKRVNLDEADNDVKEFVLNTTDTDKEHLRKATTQIQGNLTNNIHKRIIDSLAQVMVEEHPKHRVCEKFIQKLIPVWRSVD